jgi:hypothetical protein
LHSSVWVDFLAEAFFIVVFPLTNVIFAVKPDIPAVTFSFAVFPFAFVDAAGGPDPSTEAVSYIVEELPRVSISLAIFNIEFDFSVCVVRDFSLQDKVINNKGRLPPRFNNFFSIFYLWLLFKYREKYRIDLERLSSIQVLWLPN